VSAYYSRHALVLATLLFTVTLALSFLSGVFVVVNGVSVFILTFVLWWLLSTEFGRFTAAAAVSIAAGLVTAVYSATVEVCPGSVPPVACSGKELTAWTAVTLMITFGLFGGIASVIAIGLNVKRRVVQLSGKYSEPTEK
jgi:hypothetical protein